MGDDQFYIDQDFEQLRCNPDTLVSLFDTVKHEFIRKAQSDFNEKLGEYLLGNLKQLGFEFENNKDLGNFCKNRIHRISFGQDFNNHEFYLDYIDEENRGTFIGSCNDKLNIRYEENKIIVTFGNQPISKF